MMLGISYNFDIFYSSVARAFALSAGGNQLNPLAT